MVVGVELDPPVRRQVGDDLVDVHVGLGAAAGLPHHQGELLVPLPRPDLPAHGGDGPGLLRRQLAAVSVEERADRVHERHDAYIGFFHLQGTVPPINRMRNAVSFSDLNQGKGGRTRPFRCVI